MSFRAGILGLFAILTGLAGAAQAQGICKGGKTCCQKESGGVCIRSDKLDGGVPVEAWDGQRTRHPGLRYVLKKDRGQELGYVFGLATHDSKILVKPACEGSLPLVHKRYVPCKAGSRLTIYDDGGRKVAEISDAVAFDKDAYAPGGYVAYHGDALMARQQTAGGKRYVVISLASGKTVPAPPDAAVLSWARFASEGDYARFADAYTPDEVGTAQVLAVPAGTAELGPGLGSQPIYRPLTEDGTPMAMPDGVQGLLAIDGYRRAFGFGVVKDTSAGRRYLLSARGPVVSITQSGQLPAYTSLDRADLKTKPTGAARFHLAGAREDGSWTVAQYWNAEEVISEGGSTGAEALALYVESRGMALAEQQADIRAKEKQRIAEREAAEAAEAARLAAVMAVAEKCHAVLVVAAREGRWAQVPEASRYYGIRNEGWVRAGKEPGHPGACNDLYKPEYTATFQNSDLLQIAPVADLVAAVGEEPNTDVKLVLMEAASQRGETRLLADLGQLYLEEDRQEEAWNAFAAAARAGDGAGYYFMGMMEIPFSPARLAQRDPNPYNQDRRYTVAGMEESLEFSYYVLNYFTQAQELGYGPAKLQVDRTWQSIFDTERRIKDQIKTDYYRDRADLWRTCVRGATSGYEFTCYTDSQGRRVSPYTGMPY